MIVFNTYTNTYVTGFIPASVSEIACDNAIFALNNYIITSVTDKEEIDFRSIQILPSGAYLVNLLSGGMNGSKKIQVL